MAGQAVTNPSFLSDIPATIRGGMHGIVDTGRSVADFAAANILGSVESVGHKAQYSFAIAALRTEAVFDLTATTLLAACIVAAHFLESALDGLFFNVHEAIMMRLQGVFRRVFGDGAFVHVGAGYALGVGMAVSMYMFGRWVVTGKATKRMNEWKEQRQEQREWRELREIERQIELDTMAATAAKQELFPGMGPRPKQNEHQPPPPPMRADSDRRWGRR